MNHMQLHEAAWALAHTPRAGARRSALKRVLAALTLGVACALPIACGDDGTDGLSSCPDSKIVLGNDDRLHCAPRAGGPAPASPKPAAASQAKSTRPSTPAANSGSGSP
jgi:hypothetical protein